MATEQDHKLVQQATEKRVSNGSYRPSLEELKAIDQVLIEKAKERMKRPQSAPDAKGTTYRERLQQQRERDKAQGKDNDLGR